MTSKPIASIDPGDVDTEVAGRAARRISDYLSSHPGEDLIEALGEVGAEDALVIPRPTVVMLAQVLSLLESGHGVQIIPKDAELTTPAGSRCIECVPALSHQPARIWTDPLSQSRPPSTDNLRGAHGVQAARRLAAAGRRRRSG